MSRTSMSRTSLAKLSCQEFEDVPFTGQSSTEIPNAYRVTAELFSEGDRRMAHQTIYILKDRSSSSSGQVALQELCWLAKSRIADADSSNQGLFPRLSGNQPLVPPTARSRIK